jgi:peptide/nickel transport system substrate-binding protein
VTRYVRIILVFSLAIILTACVIPGTEERPAPGGTYREAVVGQPASLNPLLHPTDPITHDVASLVFAGLTRLEAGQAVADLAESWGGSPDGRIYEFKLRADARWHDGRPVTPADVLATIALLQSPTYQGSDALRAEWAGVQTAQVGDRGLRFELPSPNASFLELCTLPIQPAHLFGDDGSADLLEHPASYAPVGAGPMRFVSIDPGQLILQRNDAYYGNRPLVDRIVFRFYPDHAAALAALLAGEVDGLAGVQPGELDGAVVQESLHILDAPLLADQTVLVINHRSPILREAAVRHALALAIDREALVAGPLAGSAAPAYGPLPASADGYRSDLVETSPDRAAAATELEDADWRGVPIRARAGSPLRVQLIATERDRRLAFAIAEQLRTVGIDAAVGTANPLEYYRDMLLPGSFDLAVVEWRLGAAQADLSPFWGSAGDFNFGEYGNPRADAALATARNAADTTSHVDALAAFQQIWVDDVPGVVLASPILHYAVSTRVQDVQLGRLVDPSDRFANVARWYTQTQRVPALLR